MLPQYAEKPPSCSVSGDGDERVSPTEKSECRTRRSTTYILALGLLLSLTLWQHLLRPDNSLTQKAHILGTQVEPSVLIGQVKWWKCEDPDALPGAECGYIMYVFRSKMIFQ